MSQARDKLLAYVMRPLMVLRPRRTKTLHGRLSAARVEIENRAGAFAYGGFSSLSLGHIDRGQIGGGDDRSSQHVAEFVVFIEGGGTVCE